MRAKLLYAALALIAAAWTVSARAAGWNPEGQSEQLEAAQETIAMFKSTDSGLGVFFDKAYGYAVFPPSARAASGSGVRMERVSSTRKATRSAGRA